MSTVLSLRLKETQRERLDRIAGRLGRTRSETGLVLLEEALRREEFGLIEFRDTVCGREAFLQGTRIKAWQVVWLARDMDDDPERVAAYLEMPLDLIQAGVDYAKAYPQEIEVALAEQSRGLEELKRLIPNLHVFTVDVTAP